MVLTLIMIYASFWLSSLMSSVNGEIISDLVTSSMDESRALEIKAEQFWEPVLKAAQEAGIESHLALYADTEKVIASLSPDYTYVREALSEALLRLKRADDVVLKQAMESAELAVAQLGAPAASSGMSFLFGGQSFFRQALQRFIGGGQFSERLIDHIGQRQADILPALRGAAATTGNVLTDCRLASARSFDVLKYDIYNRGVPKTPESAKDVANRLVDAVGATRRHFTGFITKMADSIANDVKRKDEHPSVTVVQSSVQSLDIHITTATEQLINL